MNSERVKKDLIVVGGGVAGCVAAIAAGRLGVKTLLIHNRPVLGGPSGSECTANADGNFVCGAADYANANARECGILDEMKSEAKYRKSMGYDQHWSLVLREWVEREPNVELWMNTEVFDVQVTGNRIAGVTARTLESSLTRQAEAPLFIDSSGDSVLGRAAGADYRRGREGRAEFGESLAPEQPDGKTMGSSIAFRAVDVGRPVPFVPPPWAMKFPDETPFRFRPHRNPRQGYWWLEYGGEADTVQDNEQIYRKLLSILYGVWDHVKNHGDHGAANYVINWISSIPGKRESFRLMGDHLLTQRDVTEHPDFPDAVAYGGWPIDLHPPEGFFAAGHPGSTPPFTFPGTYPIPFRCLYSKNVENLMMAGRNISVTHVALGTTRVMATCALMGQAVGTAAHLCRKHGAAPRAIAAAHIDELKSLLYLADAALPGQRLPYPANLAAAASVAADSAMRLHEAGPLTGRIPLVAPPRDPAKYDPCDLPPDDRRRAQMFPVGADRLHRITLYFDNTTAAPADVELSLHEAVAFNDFSPTPALCTRRAPVPPGEAVPVSFELNARVNPGGLYYVLLSAVPGVAVGVTRRYLPGFYLKPDGAYLGNDNLALAVDPPQRVFDPDNAVNGITRAGRWPNLWMSDPAQPLPQGLTLTFPAPRRVRAVELIFDTNLHVAVREGVPAECVKDYRVEARVNGQWQAVADVSGNYSRRRVHEFTPLEASAVRLTVLTTNGDPSARVYEFRALGDG